MVAAEGLNLKGRVRMPTFGAYEGIRKVRDRGLLTAWSARAAAAKPTAAPKFLVTVGASLPWNTGDSELVVSERFLEAAELQRRVAEGGSHWAPILDTGQVDDGPYTVTAFYPRTAGDFIEGQVALSGRRLHHVVHAVLQGLIELRDAEDRAHGALRPDSVLIGSGELARTAVVLSNPAPSHDVDTYSFGVDVRALGDLVHQLVMHRPFRLTVGLPLRASEEWTRLGKKGDAWRLFCSKLLDPRPENAVGLDDAARELPALRESGRARWAVPAAAVAVLAVGGWFAAPWLVGRFTTKPVVQKGAEAQWDPERWARLCTEYNGWFAAFSDRLTPKRRARWAKDLHLAELLAKLDAADIVVDPRKIADARGLVRTMAKRPPAGAKTPEAVSQTVAALDLIDLVAARHMLTASTWPALSHIDSLADQWDARGWRRESRLLRDLVTAVRPGARLHEQIDRVLALGSSGVLDDIETRWAAVEAGGKVLDGSGDTILATFLPHARSATRSEEGQGEWKDLDALLAELGKLAPLGEKLAAFVQGPWQRDVDRGAFAAESAIHRNFDGTASRHTFTSWLEGVELFRAIPFDLAAHQAKWDAALTAIAADVKRVEARSQGALHDAARSWATLFRKERIAALAAEARKVEGIPRIARNKARLDGAVAEVSRTLVALREEARGAVLRFVIPDDPQKWLDALLAVEFSSSKALDSVWQARRKALLTGVTADGLRGQANEGKYVALRDRVTRLQSTLARLDDEAALPHTLPKAGQAYKERPWFALLAARAATRREQVVAACLGRLAWDDGVPAPLDDGVRAHWRQAFEFFASWRAEAGRLAATLGTLERALDNCTQLDEAPPGAAGTVDALLTVWEKRSILQRDAELERAAETTVRRVAALRSVAASTDRTALADQARAALAARQPGIALAAWRRLRGLAPPWPDTADEFTKDADFEARLTSMLVSLEDTERSRVLREQVGRDGLVRRGRALDRLVALVVATGDPVLARLGPLVTARKAALAKQDLKAAVSDVEALTRLARRLSDRVATDRMDRALFAAEGAVYRAEPGPDALEQWLREADGYVRLAPDDAVAKAHAGLVAREKALRQAIAGVAEERRTPLLAQLDEKVAPVTRLSAVRKNREALAAAAPDAEKTLSALGAGLELETRVARLEYELRKGAADVARESGDPVLARLSDYVEAEIQTASAKAPQERADALEALAQFGAELATFVRGDWQEKIDRKAFAAAVERPAGQPTRKTFTDWVEQARAFQYLDAEDDPRGRRATWEARRAALGTAIDRLARHGDAGKETAATWEGRLEREAWPRVQAMLDVSWIAQNRVVVAERLKAAQADVAAVDALIRAQETWFAERAALDRDLTDLAAYGEAEKQKAAAWRTRLADEGGPKARSVLDAAWSADALPGLAGRAGEAAAFLRSMRQEIAGALETPAQFVERAAQTAPASRSAALRSEWTRWRDRVLQLHTQAALEADRARYARVRERFRALSAFLEGLDDAQALPPGLPATALPEGARQAAERAVAAAREAALGAAAAAVATDAEGFPKAALDAFKQGEAWRKVCRDYAAARGGVDTVVVGAAAIEKLLAAGALPDDAPDGQESLRIRFVAWDRAREAQPPAIRTPFDPLAARVQAILAIEKLDRAALVERAAKPEGDVQIAMIAWKRLRTDREWPASAGELQIEAGLRKRLAAFAPKAAWIAPALAKNGATLWERAFHATARAATGQKGDQQVKAVLDLAPAFGVRDFATASVDARLRRELFVLRTRAAALPAASKKDAVVSELERFVRAVRALPGGVAARPAVADLLRDLAGLKAAEDAPAGAGLERAGPGAGGAGAWTAERAPDGASIRFAWTGTRHVLTFVRVEGAGRAFYLCTTEASVGLFVDVLRVANAWSAARTLLTRYDPRYPDPRRGPRCWRYRGAEVSAEKDWLTRDPTVPQPYRTAPPAPGTTHPMQYVSPEAALLVARQLGCRLPTSAEWRAAFQPGAGANLRDAAWQDHKQYIIEVRAKKARARVQWPDSGGFAPPDVTVQRRADAQALTTDNDGLLWFAPVGAGSTLQHMTGNVAEYALDAAEDFEKQFPNPAAATPAALRKFMADAEDQLKVVGGSALSPPELWDGKERPFHTPFPASLSDARYGFSDVGFRLAFSSPSTPIATQLQQTLDKHAYLP